MSVETLTPTLTVAVTLDDVARDAGIYAPSYAKPGDAGADLRTTDHIILHPGQRALVRTGLSIALPEGYAAFIHPRSGLAAKHGLTIVNAPGTVDAGYRGEIMVCLLNTDQVKSIELGIGDRIAQLVIQRVETAAFEIVQELPASDRGTGGFGSTGGFGAPAAAADPVEVPFAELPLVQQAARLTSGFNADNELGDRTMQILRDAFTLGLQSHILWDHDDMWDLNDAVAPLRALNIVSFAHRWLTLHYETRVTGAPVALSALEAIRAIRSGPAAEAAFDRLFPASAHGHLGVSINRIERALNDDGYRQAIFDTAGAFEWLNRKAAV